MVQTHTWNIAISPAAYYSWAPSTLSFSDTLIDALSPQCSINKSVTITNLTTSIIHLMLDFGGPPYTSNAFQVSTDASNYYSTVNFDVAASGTKTIYIHFCPQIVGPNSGLLLIHCTSPAGCVAGAPGSVPLSGIGTQCICELTNWYDWPDPVVENTVDQIVISNVILKNKYPAGTPDYGGAGLLRWKMFYSVDAVTYAEFSSCLMSGTTFTPCHGFTGLIQPGASNPAMTFAATAPAYNVNTAHKWYLGLKTWGQSQLEPAGFTLIIGPDGKLISNTGIILGIIGLAGLAGLLWYTKKQKMW